MPEMSIWFVATVVLLHVLSLVLVYSVLAAKVRAGQKAILIALAEMLKFFFSSGLIGIASHQPEPPSPPGDEPHCPCDHDDDDI